jgi:hypothetical protein
VFGNIISIYLIGNNWKSFNCKGKTLAYKILEDSKNLKFAKLGTVGIIETFPFR